jgi:hypothetical protein
MMKDMAVVYIFICQCEVRWKKKETNKKGKETKIAIQ